MSAHDRPAAMGDRAAAALVFGSSAAVLVVELTMLRLLAPYLGLTLETSTLVIGIALGAIALGSWSGGRAADRTDPRRLLGPLLGVSGVVVAVTPASSGRSPSRRRSCSRSSRRSRSWCQGALLSAVTPIVTKLLLTSLDQTGTVVGRLSGIGTVGAIVGTVLTGFVLVSRVPVSGILVGLGRPSSWPAAPSSTGGSRPVAVVGDRPGRRAGGLALAVAPGGCDAETTYHCVRGR